MKKYEIDLESNFELIEEYEENEDNIMVLKVYDDDNNDVTVGKTVKMFLSKNAMLGLGINLIRESEKFRDQKRFYLDPTETLENISTNLGVILGPGSSNFIVGSEKMENIKDYLKEIDEIKRK
ncbi:hypothetical protein [Fusobacterium sp. PH5-44]|uniref:hypothetical protein n=1 Tax=unclassified Fusobacterium TaxID=2648384 RepID=UPI003D1D54A1